MENPRNVTVVCYLEKEDQLLMLYRNKKKNDVNGGKWIGVGGHVEANESPEECVVREVREETGYTLLDYRYRGILTFCYNDEPAMYLFLFTSDRFTGEQTECDEGELKWIPKAEIDQLDLWQGDRIFHKLLETRDDFFAMKMVYEGDTLVECTLDGKKVEVS
ncbi:8-oxo-dGTP diphosphatase [Clostridiales bacterium COT073_COT-073]|nr:8-oxo-dGTP diphosphatase [Clostridiales bacterium COT073_COT-073]